MLFLNPFILMFHIARSYMEFHSKKHPLPTRVIYRNSNLCLGVSRTLKGTIHNNVSLSPCLLLLDSDIPRVPPEPLAS